MIWRSSVTVWIFAGICKGMHGWIFEDICKALKGFGWGGGGSYIMLKNVGFLNHGPSLFLFQFSNCVSSSSYCQWKWNKWAGNDLCFLCSWDMYLRLPYDIKPS